MTTRILHVSDTHLGKRQYKSKRRRQDFVDAFRQSIDIACGEHDSYENEPVDALLHTGDLFDSSDVSLGDIHSCQEILCKLDKCDIPFYSIIGNHERKLDTQFVDLYEDMGLAVRLDTDPKIVNEEVVLYGIDAVRKRAWETTEFTLTPPDNDGDNDGLYKIVSMHQLFKPPIEAEHMAEYRIDEVIPRFSLDIDGIALGDYHVRTSDTVDGVRVWYPGSTERCALDEEADRSVDLLEIDLEKENPLSRQRFVLDTPDFISMSVEFGPDEGLDSVKRNIESRLDKGEDTFNGEPVVVVDLKGESNSITVQQVYSLLKSYNPRVSKVRDKRQLDDVSFGDLGGEANQTSTDIDSAVENAVSKSEIGDRAERIEDIVRHSTDRSKSSMVEEVSEVITEISGDNDED